MPVTASGKMKRSFVIEDVGKHGGCKTKFRPGRYLSTSPRGAALKAFSELCRIKKIRGQCTLMVKVKETTLGSKKKSFAYVLKRKKRAKPLIIRPRGSNVVIKINYENSAKSLKKKLPCKKPGQSRGRMKKRTVKKIFVRRKSKRR